MKEVWFRYEKDTPDVQMCIRDRAGSYADTETGEVFNVGGVIGGGTAGTDCWYLSSLAIADADSSSANKADAGTIRNKAGNLASLAGCKEVLTGTVTLPEDVQAGETIKASYTCLLYTSLSLVCAAENQNHSCLSS